MSISRIGGVTLDTTVLDALIRTLDTDIDGVLRRLAFQVEANAKLRAPRDTGALINSIQAKEDGELRWIVEDGVEYGIYQELGTSKMRAQPFMNPALEAVEVLIASMVRDAMT